MRRILTLSTAAALLAVLFLLPAAAGAADREPVARMSAGSSSVEWQPLATSYESLTLTVATPDGQVIRREFRAGETPTFSALDAAGKTRPDGAYTYELRLAPAVDPAVREKLRAYRETGDRAILAELRRSGKLPQGGAVQSGSFALQGGSPVSADESEPAGKPGRRTQTGKALTNVTANDQVIPDDLIVQGSECVGLDCVNNENFGFDTIRMKENNTRIKFDDTSTSAGFSANDWQLTANDSASGGSSKFSIEDITGARVPFTITGGASTNSIFVDSTGRVGFRTSTPVLDLHVNTSNTPALRLEQNNSGGFTAQTWDIGANEANFFVRDVTGGSKLSFRVRPGAPTSSIDISSDGDVGIGTGSPSASLHVSRSDGTAKLFVDENSGTAAQRQLFLAENNGGVELGLKDTSASGGAGVEWVWQNVNAEMRFTDRGDATNEFILFQNGNATLAGTLTQLSSRTAKEAFSPVNSREMLRRVLELPITSWTYKADPGVRHVGPMSEDFFAAFALGGTDKGISVTDGAGVAFAAIQGLHQEISERDAEIAALKSQLAALAARLDQLAPAPAPAQ